MTTSQGIGRRKPPLFQLVPWSNLGSLNEDARALAQDVYLGGYAPPSVDIPWTWVRGPLRVLRDRPLRIAEVTQAGGPTARSKDPTLLNTDRVWKFTATLDSVVADDAANLAEWVTTYYDTPRPRSPELVLVLNNRTEAELYRILRVKQGTRIALSGIPASWPPGAGAWIVEGVAHQVVADERLVVWNLAPVIGTTVGESGPWYYADDSRSSGTDVIPF